MAQAAGDIEALIALMARLPGLGPRSARRAVPVSYTHLTLPTSDLV